MAFFDGLVAKLGDVISGLATGNVAVILKKSTGEADVLKSNDDGAAMVSDAGMAALAANTQATGTITTAAAGAGNTVAVLCAGKSMVSLEVTANTNVAMVIEGQFGNGSWYSINGYGRNSGAPIAGFASSATGTCLVPCGGLTSVRVRGTAVGATPTATVKLEAGPGIASAMMLEKIEGATCPSGATGVITKSDATVYDPPLKVVFATGAGNLALVLAGHPTNVITVPVDANEKLSCFLISMVMSTGTTATGISGAS